MSGIAGLVNLDGRPVDRHLLDRLTRFMQFRGPDAQETWLGGRVGFGHAMLRTTFESRGERQPCSLDGRVWIVADARVDGRSELRRKLRSAGHAYRQDASDAELILYAYEAWGESCVRHLIGDFAFAIWDGPRERLFCARDHFGVKPFFYACADNCLVLSNTLSCVRQHPAVSDELSDFAIADFLLFGANQDDTSTAFAEVRRLPPAHRLSWSAGILHVERYWDLPTDGHLRYRKARDYVDHFTEHLNAAVADRLRSHRVGVFMSGGLDSTAVAATAEALLSQQPEKFDLRAYTCVYDRLIREDERHFSQLAADSLGMPIHYLVADDYSLFDGWRTSPLQFPEPADDPLAILHLKQVRQTAANCRVALTGWDGDALMSERAHGGVVCRGANLIRRAARTGWRALSARRLPRLDLGARLARMIAGRSEEPFACPGWLNPDLVAHLDLPMRWRELQAHSHRQEFRRAQAHRALRSPLLARLLEKYDPGVTRSPVEARHPLLDVRMVEYLLSVPVSPWCIDKMLLREAMRDRLPEPVRLRPKTPVLDDPVLKLLQRAESRWVDAFEPNPFLSKYVDKAAIPPLAYARDSDQAWADVRPLCLNLWLQQLTASVQKSRHEEHDEVA